jgi:hypothetical protein
MRLSQQLELLNHELQHRLMELERKIAITDHHPASEASVTDEQNGQQNPFLNANLPIAPRPSATAEELGTVASGEPPQSSQPLPLESKSTDPQQTGIIDVSAAQNRSHARPSSPCLDEPRDHHRHRMHKRAFA